MQISNSVRKKDSYSKVSGEAKYVADFYGQDIMHGEFLRSDRARANIVSLKYPALEEGYTIVDYRDIPGVNEVHIVLDDMPVFTEKEVKYIGDPICLVCGPDKKKVQAIIDRIEIEYEDLEPVLDMDNALENHFEYNYVKGDSDKAFAEADVVIEEEFRTGYQEQAYLETQGMIGDYKDGYVTVRGSLQCPYYVHRAVAKAMAVEQDQVNIVQEMMGGAFGGKEDYPSILACQVAVASKKAGKPVKVIFSRREDITVTSKKHPSHSFYKAAVKDGRITGMEIFIRYDGGAYTTLSSVVLMRGIISSTGCYTIDNLKVGGEVAKTHTVPTGAFRGFGAPQVFFAIEMMMNHVADAIQEDRVAFKKKHLSKQGDRTSTNGKYHFPIVLPQMFEEVEKASDYQNKKKAYQNQSGRYRRGIEMSTYFHGAGFTGTGERDLIKAVAKLKKHQDGQVEILVANTEMGQGIFTTLSKIVGDVLDLPYDQIIYKNPETKDVPDSGPTVASRSVMVVGELLRRAALRLKQEWKDGQEQVITENYVEPEYKIAFDPVTFQGDAYPTFSWAVVAVEMEVDTLTGEHQIIGTWGRFDVGTPIDMNIVIGQLEGGVTQGLGHSSMEQMDYNSKGRIRNNSLSDYILPTSKDIGHLDVKPFLNQYPSGPFGAKGCGELPVVGVAPAYVGAIEQCVGKKINHMPITMEETLELLQEVV